MLDAIFSSLMNIALQNQPLTAPSAAGLNLTEPCSTGIGGDMFCLFYSASTKKVSALNGSGRAPAANSVASLRADLGVKEGETGKIPMSSVHAVTVPGAAAGWIDTVEMFGSGNVTMEDILMPAIEMGEKGYPISELTSYYVRIIPRGSILDYVLIL